MRSFTRRHLLRWLLGLFLSPLLSFRSFHANGAEAVPPAEMNKKGDSIGTSFTGEELVYEIGFWLAKRVAIGKLSFRPEEKKGHYLAILQGEISGLLGWLTRYRVDTYRSTMEEIDGGRRLRALSFEEDVKIGSKTRRRMHFFDYEKRRWITTRIRSSGILAKTEEEIPAGMVYDDFVTASYNFRYGVYGAIERGRTYTVPTFPRKGPSQYEVIVASKEEEERRRKSEKIKGGKEFFLKLYLDPEITHSREGLIEGWLSKELFPLEGTIRDVVLFGDVKGTLVKKSKG